jgi:hypothetical protein
MAQESLLRMLEEAASKVKLVEREKSEAVAKIQALEREAGELRSLISLAESKADEILKGGATDQISESQAVNVPAGSKSLEQLVEPSASQQKGVKRRLPGVFSSI